MCKTTQWSFKPHPCVSFHTDVPLNSKAERKTFFKVKTWATRHIHECGYSLIKHTSNWRLMYERENKGGEETCQDTIKAEFSVCVCVFPVRIMIDDSCPSFILPTAEKQDVMQQLTGDGFHPNYFLIYPVWLGMIWVNWPFKTFSQTRPEVQHVSLWASEVLVGVSLTLDWATLLTN